VVSIDFMRLSLKKAAYVAVYESSVVGNPECAPTARRGRRDDKFKGGAHLSIRYGGWTERPIDGQKFSIIQTLLPLVIPAMASSRPLGAAMA
jgi:hypothetical protein